MVPLFCSLSIIVLSYSRNPKPCTLDTQGLGQNPSPCFRKTFAGYILQAPGFRVEEITRKVEELPAVFLGVPDYDYSRLCLGTAFNEVRAPCWGIL